MSKLIYLIDDYAPTNYLHTELIQAVYQDAEIKSFENAFDALNELKEPNHEGRKTPDVIFLDINMPLMSGWDFLNMYKRFASKMGYDIPIYLLSTFADAEYTERSKTYEEVKGYLTKPLSVENVQNIFG